MKYIDALRSGTLKMSSVREWFWLRTTDGEIKMAFFWLN